MTNLTANETNVLNCLWANEEGGGTVYLDNVNKQGLCPKGFAAVLGSLTQKGLYRPLDGFFGEVLGEKPAPAESVAKQRLRKLWAKSNPTKACPF
jgi:hypothetical protein